LLLVLLSVLLAVLLLPADEARLVMKASACETLSCSCSELLPPVQAAA